MAKTVYVGKKGDNYIIIRCNVSGQDTSILISSAEPLTSNATSNITTNPLVTGDYIADHMFVQPKNITIRGTLSINDGVSGNFNTRISEFEKLVNKIKDEAIKCNIATIRSSSSRFLAYGEMALNSISFTENVNSLDFTLGFQQILMTDVTVKPYDKSDPWLPSVDPAQSLSFIQEYFDWNTVTALVIQECVRLNIIDQKIIDDLNNKLAAYDYAQSAAGGLVLGGVGIAAFALTAGVAAGPFGLIAAGVGVAGLAIFQFLKGIVEDNKRDVEDHTWETNRALFEYTDDVEKNEQTEKDLVEWTSSIAKRLLQLNNQIFVYHVDLTEDTEVYASINNDYYIFNFRRSSNGWLMDLYDVNGNLLKGNVVSRDGLRYFDQVNSATSFYKKGNVRFYMFLDKIVSSDDGKGSASVRILAYIGNPDDFKKEVEEIIRNAFNERVVG